MDIKGYKSSPIFGQLTIIFDFTVEFTTRYIKTYRRKDQMDEAARSGKQCWAEAFLQKSLEGRLKLMGVTRGSLEELLQDFLDFIKPVLAEYAVGNPKKPEYIKIHTFQTGWMPENPTLEA